MKQRVLRTESELANHIDLTADYARTADLVLPIIERCGLISDVLAQLAPLLK